MTQENKRAPRYEDYQRKILLAGEEVWADPELIPLLTALNDAGLATRSHCCGHGADPAWVAIRLDNCVSVEMCIDGEYNEMRLTWRPSKRKDSDQ